MANKLITVRDVRLALYAVHGSTEGFAVEIRPNGAVWVYAAIAHGLVNGQMVNMVPKSVASRVLSGVVDHLGKSHKIFPKVAVSSGIDGVEIDTLRHPRMEIHPQVVGGVL